MAFDTQTSFGLSGLRDEPEPYLYSSTDSSGSSLDDSDPLPALTPRGSDASSSSSDDTVDSSENLPPADLSSSSSDPPKTKAPKGRKKKRQTREKKNVPRLTTSETITVDSDALPSPSESVTMTARSSEAESIGAVTSKMTTAQKRATHKRQKSTAARLGNLILSNLVGITINSEEKEVDIPEGYELKFTEKGQSYLVRQTLMSARDEEVMDEHVRKGAFISICASRGVLGTEYGEGVYQYFDFVLFLCLTNAILQLISGVHLGAHFYYDGWNSNQDLWLNIFTISYNAPWWFWCLVVCCIFFMFFFGPLLAARISRRFYKIGYEDTEDRYTGSGLDVIKDKKGFPQNPVHLSGVRMFISYLLFIVILAISGSITFGLVFAQTYFNVNLPIPWSVIVSVVLELSNFVWKKICLGLTNIERHYTWTSFNKHHTLKYFLWRFLNVSIMFLARWLVSERLIDNVPIWAWIRNLAPVRDPTTICDLRPVGEQIALLLIIDMTLGNAIDVGVPWLRHKWAQCRRKDQMGSELETGRPEFDIAEGYLNYMYRQYIVYLGLPFFPLVGTFGLVANLIDYQMDKFLLLRIARTPPPLRGSMKHYLIFFLFITAITSIAVFPYGVGWVLAGFTMNTRCSSSGLYSAPFISVLGQLAEGTNSSSTAPFSAPFAAPALSTPFTVAPPS